MTSISTAGGGIKSIQRGFTYTDVAVTTSVTITEVDLTKSFVSASTSNGFAGNPTYTTNASMSSARLDDSTTVKIYAGSAYSVTYQGGPYSAWTVVEYA